MGQVKEWMGLYMWANDSRTEEIQHTLSSLKSKTTVVNASKSTNADTSSSKTEGQAS